MGDTHNEFFQFGIEESDESEQMGYCMANRNRGWQGTRASQLDSAATF